MKWTWAPLRLDVCACIHTYIYIYIVYIYISYTYIYISYIHIYISYIHIYIYHIYIIYIYILYMIYIHTYIYIYTHIYMYTHIRYTCASTWECRKMSNSNFWSAFLWQLQRFCRTRGWLWPANPHLQLHWASGRDSAWQSQIPRTNHNRSAWARLLF